MRLFGWQALKELATRRPPAKKAVDGLPAAHVILDDLGKRIPQYLDEADQGKLIYPACKRTLSDASGDVGSIWDHTRLEAMRYIIMIPGRDFQLLIGPARQQEMIDAYLFQRPHGDTVVDFTGVPKADFAIAIMAGLNWLSHCAQLAGVDRDKQSGTLRNFRRTITLAQQFWMTPGAAERCAEMLASGQKPPLMFFLVWSEYTRLAKQIAAAAIFGPSIDRVSKLVVLPAGLTTRFETAEDPADLLAN